MKPALCVLLAAASVLACAGVVTPRQQAPAPAQAPAEPEPELTRLERSTVDAINDVREEAGLLELSASGALVRVARAHSEDQARMGKMGHLGSNGTTLADRARGNGIAYHAIAENVAMNEGYADPVATAVDGWMRSDAHKRNILNPAFTETGVGVAAGADGAIYFTQVFLDPRR